jgi:nucleotide-binding universal stress UspA family protein
MQKLTSILVVLERPADAGVVLVKAVHLARLFDARLQLLAIEPVSTRRVAQHCAALGYPDVTVHSASRLGRHLHAVVVAHVEELKPDLVIKARAGSHPLRRFSLKNNDWRLSQDCPVPLLLTGPRPWANPPRFAAAIDVSDPDSLDVARALMQAAGFLVLGARGNVDLLYTEREQHDDVLRMERAVRLAQLVREFHVGCERLQMFDGVPEKRLPPLITARQYDLVLIGAVSHRTGLVETACPVISRLAEAATGDVLLVPGETASSVARTGPSLTGKQVAHQGQQFV